MKKIIIMSILVSLMCVTLFGCGKTETTSNLEENKTQNNLNTTNEYNYRDGVLTQIVDEKGNPKQTDFIINGIILIGNRHSYAGLSPSSSETIDVLASEGYKKEGINSSFYLNEYIEFYIDTDYSGPTSDIKVLITPHKTVEELEKMSISKLEKLALENGGAVMEYTNPDRDNYNYIGEVYVDMNYPEGKYDILFTYKGEIAYFININETKEE